MVPSLSTGPSATDSDLEPLDEKLQPIEAVAQCVQRTRNRGKEFPRIGVLESVVPGVGGLHRALARQEPLPADRQRRAERHHEFDAGGLPLEISTDGLRVCAGDFSHSAVGTVTNRRQESLVQG